MKPTGRVVRVIQLGAASDAEVASFVADVPSADLVVMVVPAGADAAAAATIGGACSDSRVVTTSIVVRHAKATEEALSRTLAQVRPWSLMVVVAGADDYVDDILRSFR